MIRFVPGALSLTVVAALAAPVPAEAQIYQVQRGDARNAIGVNLGYFALRGEDARDPEDVVRINVFDQLFDRADDFDPLAVDHFNGASFGGEWTYRVSDYLEAGVGIGFYRKTVESIYRDFTDTDESDIRQDFRLRVAPVTAIVRFLPVGRGAAVEPYVGAGLGIFLWRYSETGEFIDFFDDTIFSESYRASGTAYGPVILGGVGVPVGDAWSLGGEVRWQRAEGDTTDADPPLVGTKIDLGGVTYSVTMHFRF